MYAGYFGVRWLFWHTLVILAYAGYFGVRWLFWRTLVILAYAGYFSVRWLFWRTLVIFAYSVVLRDHCPYSLTGSPYIGLEQRNSPPPHQLIKSSERGIEKNSDMSEKSS